MIVDLERDLDPPNFSADVCIVGAGAAGIVLAAELTRHGKRVLLLESGGTALESAAQALNECSYSGQSQRAGSIGRFRVLGGTTTAWGGQILEFGREDFAVRPWVAGSGWPFSKEELKPYYEKALLAEDLSDVIRDDSEVWRRVKMAAPDLGACLEPYFTRWCPEPNFARLYSELLASANLCVVLHATATAMLLDESGARLRGVQCKTPSGREQFFSAARYVLCLGTIETVRFLLQPLPGIDTLPWNGSDMLGQHFQSHIDFNAAQIPPEKARRLRMLFANAYLKGKKYHPKFRLAFGLQEREKLLNIAGSITCINDEEPELQHVKSLVRNAVQGRSSRFHMEDLWLALRQARIMMGLGYGYAVEHRAYWPKRSTFWLRVHCEQEPLSRSRIKLLDKRDATGLLRVQLDWRVSTLEWKTIRFFNEQVERAFAARGWGTIATKPELPTENGYCSVTFDNSHHDMGGTRMATNAAEGVVDAQLRLHGVDNAYVCSASVFPSSGFSNPTHTLIALAIRLADHLKEKADA